jgi:CRP-like cAMP-binding protein
MPEDMIMNRGEIGTHIYFFVEGTALILGADKKQVIGTLDPGSYIGKYQLFV